MQNVLRRATVVTIIVAGQVILNADLAFNPSSFCNSRTLQPVINGFVWVSWNTLLCLLAIESNCTNLITSKERSDGTVSDKPFWSHWRKLIIWIPFTGAYHPASTAPSLPLPFPHACLSASSAIIMSFITQCMPAVKV